MAYDRSRDAEIPLEPDWLEVVDRHAELLTTTLGAEFVIDRVKAQQEIVNQMKLLVNEITQHWY